jgi:hypothetical protein
LETTEVPLGLLEQLSLANNNNALQLPLVPPLINRLAAESGKYEGDVRDWVAPANTGRIDKSASWLPGQNDQNLQALVAAELGGIADGTPVLCISYNSAKAVAVAVGMRLPKDSEWVEALNLGGNAVLPPPPAAVVAQRNTFRAHLPTQNLTPPPPPVLHGVPPQPNGGFLDLNGSLAEWVTHPPARQEIAFAIGGSFLSAPRNPVVADQVPEAGVPYTDVGFRLAFDPPPGKVTVQIDDFYPPR